jgi:hypothetical protein
VNDSWLPAARRVSRRLVPRGLRIAGSRAIAAGTSRALERSLRRIGEGRRPVIAGPWLGEVGFELLYWIPFLRWALAAGGIDPARVTAVSRGGPEAWYQDVAGRYRDVLDFWSAEEFRNRNEARSRAAGERKQAQIGEPDREIFERVMLEVGGPADLLHPSLMYGLYRTFWWGHATPAWVHRHARFGRYRPAAGVSLPALPAAYVAVKFYFNECFPATDQNRAAASLIVRRLSERTAVVELSTGLALDDHSDYDLAGRAASVRSVMTPRDNLAVQSAVVERARGFVGTYGGFSYLAPFHGIPSIGLYSRPEGFSRAHLGMALSAFEEIPGARLQALAVDDPAAMAAIDRLGREGERG